MLAATRHRFRSVFVRLAVAMVAVVAVGVPGCTGKKRPVTPTEPNYTSRYPQLPPKELPEYLKGTILERVDVVYTAPRPVSGYGLVANLNGTGDTRAPNPVREYMIRQMQKRGFGSRNLGYEDLTPEKVLDDPRFAIVRVDGLIPPGARRGQRFDVQVSALGQNETSSLSHGALYRTELKIEGANPRNPGSPIDVFAFSEGEIFVNPAYALQLNPSEPQARNSLRSGTVLGGGVVQIGSPLGLRLRQPQYRVSRMIDLRLDEFLQDGSYAQAKDEGMIYVTVPPKYGDDWEHFRGVITHVYFNNSQVFITAKAKELAEKAVEPDAPLLDISYCWEALGQPALPFVTPLMIHEKPDVAYAAARAAALIGDVSAQSVLIQMARTQDHPFQLNAVQTLAKLPGSPEIAAMLRSLLNSPHTLVRLEAYRALSAEGDSAIFARNIEDKYYLDIVPADGPPLLYASRRSLPRLAVFGRKPTLSLPITFTAMDGKLSISSTPGRRTVTVFYRGPGVRRPVTIESNPDIAEIAARLGGAGPLDEARLDFSYCDVVAVLQALVDQQKVAAQPSPGQQAVPVAFVLQEVPSAEAAIYDAAPVAPQQDQRPQSDSPGTVSLKK